MIGDWLTEIPIMPDFAPGIRRAPRRLAELSPDDEFLAVENALRYIPTPFHPQLAPEFLRELRTVGRVYGYRFRPPGRIQAKPVDAYQGSCIEGRAFQLMLDNNLDFEIALYPYELVTYGETGQVCQNWMQYQLIRRYLEALGADETLVVQSGHPLGLFKSHALSPRVIITNGLMVGLYDNPKDWARAAALGVTNYGQMTAGGWMYIGPQGIVHGTFNTLLIAGRKKLGTADTLKGKLFVSSGLGGMSGAQGKAIRIAGGVGIIAEVDESRAHLRLEQGWVDEVETDIAATFQKAQAFQRQGRAHAIAFLGNVVEILEAAASQNILIDLLTDQTSCHAVYEGGYTPVGMTFSERTKLLADHPQEFRLRVNESLKRHFSAIERLSKQGAYFFDYGNAFLKAVLDAGITRVSRNGRDDRSGFVFPSYIEDLMGPELFDFGYGPFRWVCLSGDPLDLKTTDLVAAEVIEKIRPQLRVQDVDNLKWVREAGANGLVVGSQARILYQDAEGRTEIALRFNQLVREKRTGPILLGRDHHDTGSADSPFRETSNIRDGSNICADMAVHSFAGNAARGMSLVALHNGGGTGIGRAINGGFALVLDGSRRIDSVIRAAISWDVMGGVSRRAWARNPNAIATVRDSGVQVTLPHCVNRKWFEKWRLELDAEGQRN